MGGVFILVGTINNLCEVMIYLTWLPLEAFVFCIF